MNILERHSIFFHFLSFSFMFFHVLSFSFIFFDFRSFSFIFIFIFFHFLPFSFIVFFFPFFSFFFLLVLLFFSGAQNPFFLPRLPHDFLLKLLCKKSILGAVSGSTPLGPLFFSCLFYHFLHFRFLFQFISMFFLFFLCSSFFMFSFIFLLFPSLTKSFFLFHFVSLFSSLGCPESVAALQVSLGKRAHSELALFALYWLVVTFPCGIVHMLVMIRLRVVHGGRRVGQVLPSYQNRQINPLDETADAPQSSLLFSSLLSPLRSFRFLPLPFASFRFLSLPFASFRFLSAPLRFASPRVASLRVASRRFASRRFASLRFASLLFSSLLFASLLSHGHK